MSGKEKFPVQYRLDDWAVECTIFHLELCDWVAQGIVSAAVDGLQIASAVARAYAQQ